MNNADSWSDTRRIEAWAGELRVNLVRLAAILFFYGHHLLNVYLFRDDPTMAGPYHAAVTALVIAWASSVVVMHFCLSRRWVPPWLKYCATLWDILLITLLLLVTGSPHSWLPVLYLLVIATAPLRLDLALVYLATFASLAGYLFFLGYLKYWLHVPDGQRLSRPNQVIFILALGAAGLLAGQMVRQARRLCHGYPVSVEKPQET